MFQAPPLLLSADFDPFQAAIIVIALIAGFVKWLWENWQQKREQAKLAVPPDPEEQRLREAAWRKQTGQSAPPPPPPAAPSPWDELRKAWRELQETAKQAQAPARPVKPVRPAASASRPPPVPQQRQQPVRTTAPAAPAPPPVVATVAVPAPAAKEAYYPQQKTTTVSVLAALQHLRRDPARMRQAILMQEILGPPKALQTSRDLAI